MPRRSACSRATEQRLPQIHDENVAPVAAVSLPRPNLELGNGKIHCRVFPPSIEDGDSQMRKFAVAALALPVLLAGCVYSHDRDRVATAPAVVQTPPTVVERRVVPE